jgi:UDP-glucose 4-epimerase
MVDIFNVGSVDQIEVKKIAEIITKALNIKKVKIILSGGVDGGRGWRGDVKKMQLSIDKLRATLWEPKYSSEQAIRLAAESISMSRKN